MKPRVQIFRLVGIICLLSLIGTGPSRADGADYDLSRLEAFSWVLLQLKQDYVDPTRVEPDKMLEKVLDYIERRQSEVEISLKDGQALVNVGSKSATFKVGKPATVWEMNYNLQPIFQFIGDNLEDGSDPKQVEFAAINGLLSTLDPHSNLLPPELFREMQLKTTGEFGGLGIRITIRKGALTIISPLPDTPAARLGLKAMDQIVRIGDQSTVNMPLDEAVNLLRGRPGSKVAIWVKRVGWSEPHKYMITRETIRVRSVTSKLLKDKVGYISLQDFSRHTGGDLLRHLADLKRESRGLKGLIIDLRNNAGGLMKAAVQVADLFLDRGIIVATVAYGEDSTPEERVQKLREEQRATEDGVEGDLPIVVLVNSGSASASEILAGALKNLDRAVLMGEQTFGKGTVQILNDRVPPSVDGACLKLTVAEYLIPGDISIQEIGVTPDIKLVPMILDKEDPQVFAQPERFREEDIPTRLHSQQGKVTLKPAFELRYLFDPPKKKDDDEEPPLADPGFKEDFEIRMAREYLVKNKSVRGTAMLDEGAGFIQEAQKRELKKMAEKMRELDLDWSTGGGEGARAKVSFKVLGEGLGKDGLAQADKKIKLRLDVTNDGTAPFYRLRAESRSPIGLFDRREFLFGRLDPGQTRSWEVPIKVPRGSLTRTDELRFLFNCEGGAAPDPLNTTIGIKGLPRPSFGFSWRVSDPQGNGDGLIQPGEKVALELTVTNFGQGKAFDAKALLKNDAGKDLFLQSGGGRLLLKEIAAGASATQSFKFRVRKDTTRTELPVELTIWDSALSATQVARIKLPVHSKRPKPGAIKAGLRVTRSRASVRGGADVTAPVVAFARKGTILKADGKSGDWYRLVDSAGKSAGWINVSAVKKTKASAAKPASKKNLLGFVQLTPPKIKLDSVPVFVKDGDQVTLRGKIVDDDHDLRDLAVWVGNDKIQLKSGSQVKNARQFDLDVVLPLEPGPNYVTVIAREGERFSAHHSVVISRPGGLDKKKKKGEEEDVRLLP